MSKAMDEALKAVKNMAPQDEVRENFIPSHMTGSYTGETLAQLEVSHLRLMEVAANALAYLNPHLYAYQSIKCALEQAETIRAKVGIA